MDSYINHKWEFLIASGADPNAVDRQGEYLLTQRLIQKRNSYDLKSLIWGLENYGFDIWRTDHESKPFIDNLVQACVTEGYEQKTGLAAGYAFFMKYWQEVITSNAYFWRTASPLPRWVDDKWRILRYLVSKFASVLTPEMFTRLALNQEEVGQLFTTIDENTRESLADKLMDAVDSNANLQTNNPVLNHLSGRYKQKTATNIQQYLQPVMGNIVTSYAVFDAGLARTENKRDQRESEQAREAMRKHHVTEEGRSIRLMEANHGLEGNSEQQGYWIYTDTDKRELVENNRQIMTLFEFKQKRCAEQIQGKEAEYPCVRSFFQLK